MSPDRRRAAPHRPSRRPLAGKSDERSTLEARRDPSGRHGRALDFIDAIVETVRQPLLVLDGNLRVETANRGFHELFKVAPEETVGRLLSQVGGGQWNVPELRRALEDVLAGASRLDALDLEAEFPQIGRRTIRIDARKLRDDSGHEGILLSMEDRTEPRAAETEREALQVTEQETPRPARDTDAMKDQFVATLSHELRGPLNAMVGWLHVVRGRGIDEATRERALGAIERAVRAQTRMIEDLFDYSRLVTGKLRLFSRPIDLLSVTTAAVESVRLAAEAKEISLELASEAKPAMVRGDWDRLQQVVWNLVSNAVKFTPRGGRVQVAIERAGTYLHLRVSDTGQGIPPDVLAHLFDRFRRAEGPRSRSQSGLGLGLTMVKQLVEQHGGRVRADSAGEGHGATFTVALPTPALLLEREVAEPAGRGTETAPASANEFAEWARTMLAGVSVLVVEDDAESREMLVTVLRRCGANVRQAVSALEAMEALEHERPDVVVCDIGLPDRDGYSLIRRVRELSPERGGTVPALALTAYAGPDDRDMTLAAGFDLYLAKPADPEQLVTRIAALAGGARNTR